MKTLAALLFLSSLGAQAAVLKCEQNDGWQTNDLWVTALVSGEFQAVSDKEVVFDDAVFAYKLYDSDHMSSKSIWSQGAQLYKSLGNSLSYNPRKYKGHMKFSVYVDDRDTKGYGYLDLIVPADKMLAAKKSEFTGYLIMTWMDDHFGGTAKLNCKID